jgi:ABC-2 type transport system ATP-binding protein
VDPRDAEVILSLRDIRKAYGDLEAVRGLSLDVLRGEIFGFLGPNGAGKTTTIRMVCGLLRGDGGEILVRGRNLSSSYRQIRRLIGLCPQELVIWETLTCQEQLTFVGTQYDLGRREARLRGLELLEVMGLREKRNQRARTLSGGMKRRLNLALALVHDPDILILDEPQAGLDPQSRILVREYIRSLAEEKTVLLTTHEMDEADRLASRIGIIDRGRLLVMDSPEALKKSLGGREILEIRLADGQGEALNRLMADPPDGFEGAERFEDTLKLSGEGFQTRLHLLQDRLQEVGLTVRDLTVRRPTLEDVFISLTGRGLRE